MGASATLLFLTKFATWLAFPFSLAGLALLAAALWPGVPRRPRALCALALALLWGGGCRLVSERLAGALESRTAPLAPSEAPADAIVVLGGGIMPALAPRRAPELSDAGDRVLEAARLWREGRAPLVVACGGSLDGTPPEAADLATLLRFLGVAPEAILEETRSRTTRENAVEARRLLDPLAARRILLVTSALHMPRAAALFRGPGLRGGARSDRLARGGVRPALAPRRRAHVPPDRRVPRDDDPRAPGVARARGGPSTRLARVSEAGALRQKVRRSLPWSVAAGAIQIALSLLSMVLLVRYLEPREYGVWSILAALSTLVNLFASFGFAEFIMRFVPAIEMAPAVARTVWSIVARRMALAALVSAALVAGFDLYASRFGLAEYRIHVAIYQLTVFFAIGSLYLQYAMNARFMQREVVLLAFPVQTALVALTLLGIWRKETLLYFVVVTTAVTAANFALSAYVLSRRYPLSLGVLVAPVPQTAEQVRYRRLSYVDEFGVNFLSTDIARYLVSYFSNNVEVAIYSVATTIVARLQFFLPGWMLRSLTDATFYARYEQTRDPADLGRMFRLLYGTNTVACFVFVATFLPFGRELLELVFRDAYAAAYAPVLILLLFLVLHFMPVGLVVKALQRPEILIYSKAAVLLNVALGIPLASRHGATGMVIATALSVALKNAIMLGFVWREMALPLPWRATLRSALAAAIAAGGALVAKPWLPLPLGLALACAIYAAAVRFLKPLDAGERALLAAMVPAAARPPLRWLLGR